MKIFRIVAPTSKSTLQREIIVALLSEEPTRIEFDSLANDTAQALRIAGQIGDCHVEIAEKYRVLLAEECVARNFSADNLIYIKSCATRSGEKSSAVISKNFEKLRATREVNCGESGLLLHLLAGYFAANLHGETVKISGEGTLNSRRVRDLIRVLEAIGLKVNHAGELLPLEISGEIARTKTGFSGLSGSQAISGLMIAFAERGGEISANNLKSRNYALMTAEVLKRRGNKINLIQAETELSMKISAGRAGAKCDFSDCGDASGASFWFVLGACRGGIEIANLDPQSLQPDLAIVEIIRKCGAEVKFENGAFRINKPANGLAAFDYDATNSPDLIPNLVVLASQCSGKSTIRGAARLRNKESDRRAAILGELAKVGIRVALRDDDTFEIIGGVQTSAEKACVSSHSDHRIIMALCLAGLLAGRSLQFDSTVAVGKSYPEFFYWLMKYV